MFVPFGTATNSRPGSTVTVGLDTRRAVNCHGAFLGPSGFGKTHRLRDATAQVVNSAAKERQPIRVHVIDPHGDLRVEGASTVKFSESTQWGFNPLEINPDPDYGGVRRVIQQFIAALNRQKFVGTKQESVLRYLLEDLFTQRGFLADKPETWVPEDPRIVRQMLAGKEDRLYLDVAYEHRDHFKALVRDGDGRFIGGWDGDLKGWWVEKDKYAGDLLMWSPRVLFKTSPTVDDLLDFTELKLKAMKVGGNGAATALLQEHMRVAAAFHNRSMELSRKGEAMSNEERETAEVKLEQARLKAVDSYASFLGSVTHGREIRELIRYNSVDVLTSVYERVQNMRATGIFRPGTPPFDPRAAIWRYNIKPLGEPEQRLFVEVLCRRIFERAVQRGEQADVVEVVLVDEAKRFVYKDEESLLTKITNEARKFGLVTWVGAQSSDQLPDEFLNNLGFKVVLGLPEGKEGVKSALKLGIDEALAGKIEAKNRALIQVRNAGGGASGFVLTEVR